MLLSKASGLSVRWLLALVAGVALAMVLSFTIVDHADAAPLTEKERLLASKKLWFEWDWDRDGVCYMYDIRKGTSTVGPYLQVVRTSYYVNPFTGRCYLSVPNTFRGGVGRVIDGELRIHWPSAAGGYVERVRVGQYRPDLAAIPISRKSTGGSWWQNCASPDHPFC